MDIYTDYANWKFENHEFMQNLIKNNSASISRFTSVIMVVDYLYDQVVNNKTLTQDEQTIFSIGFDYIYNQFHIIKTIWEYQCKKDFFLLNLLGKTINLLLYTEEFISEAKDYSLQTTELLDLKTKIEHCLEQQKNAPDEYFMILNDIISNLFEQNEIEIHTIDQIYTEIAAEYGIYEAEDNHILENFLLQKIEKRNKK